MSDLKINVKNYTFNNVFVGEPNCIETASTTIKNFYDKIINYRIK
jgi:hypothetical protein